MKEFELYKEAETSKIHVLNPRYGQMYHNERDKLIKDGAKPVGIIKTDLTLNELYEGIAWNCKKYV